jgi:DNA processing protein
MLEEELIAVLALQKAKGIGDIIAKKLISHCGNARNVFSEKRAAVEKINGIGSITIASLKNKECLLKAEKEAAHILAKNISYTYFQDALYPEKLKHCIDGPIIMFKDGNINIQKQPIISIVGSRKMTLYGRDFIHELMETIAPYNPIIVSGFAYGVDITAQKSAVDHNLQTIGVLAHGLDQIYPKSHKKYIHKVNENGGFFTDFWHDEGPLRENFLKRNRIVAGISDATIIIESAEKGGSLVTADIANSYSRDVFAVPGKTTDTLSKGCNDLIKRNKAGILTCPEDLIELLNWNLNAEKKPVVQKQLFIELTEEEQRIYDCLLANGKQYIDAIALQCNIPVYKLATLLFSLEMKGVIRPLQGKLFETT